MAESKPSVRIAGRVAVLVALGAAVAVAAQAAGLLNEREVVQSPIASSRAKLHRALSEGDVKTVLEEIQRGVDINSPIEGESLPGKDRDTMTPLILAAFEGNAACVEALVKSGAKTEARAKDGRTALIYAAGWGDAQKVRALIDGKANLDARAADGMTAVMFAAARGEPQTLQALLDAGCRINDKNRWGQTALIAAARSGSPEKVTALLSAGAEVAAVDQFGESALMIAAGADVPAEIVSSLIKAGAAVNAADADGVTALMKAAERGDVDQVRVLLANGADKAIKDTANNWTAADWAAKRDDDRGRQVVELLSK